MKGKLSKRRWVLGILALFVVIALTAISIPALEKWLDLQLHSQRGD